MQKTIFFLFLIFLSSCTYYYPKENIITLPYLEYSNEKDDLNDGIILSLNKSYIGYTLADSNLIDMDGNIILRLPNYNQSSPSYARAFKEFLYVGYEPSNEYGYLVKYNSSMKLEWAIKFPFHHDFDFDSDGNIYALSKEKHNYKGRLVVFDSILKITPNGSVKSLWSSYESLNELQKYHKKTALDYPSTQKNSPEMEEDGTYEYYHMNSIQIISNSSLSHLKKFQKGNILLSFHRVDMVAILDKNTYELVWHFSGKDMKRQHSPKMLENGNILIFDNGDDEMDYSKVIEINPITKDIVWEYKLNNYCYEQGFSQRLPNGNTLITNSVEGEIFEVTKDNKITWFYRNPIKNEEGKRQKIYRATRYDKDVFSNYILI